MKHIFSLLALTLTFLLSACSPHPTSGVWQATEDNEPGIEKLVVAFDGKAYFTTSKYDDTKWHCFWTANSAFESDLKCTPSTNPDREEDYSLTTNKQGMSQLHHNNQLIASFIRLNENPSPRK